MPRTVNGTQWTSHGGWVVVAEWMGAVRVVFDPEEADETAAFDRCAAWVEDAHARICA